jgi:polyferredoxin
MLIIALIALIMLIALMVVGTWVPMITDYNDDIIVGDDDATVVVTVLVTLVTMVIGAGRAACGTRRTPCRTA